MFMFCGKRAVYIKRLLSAQVCREYETECETQGNSSSTRGNTNRRRGETCCDRDEPTTTTMVTELPGSRRNETCQHTNGAETSRTRGGGRGMRLCHACCGGGDSQDDYDDEEDEREVKHSAKDSVNRFGRCKQVLKGLKEHQLEMMLAAVDSYGADLSSCIFVSKTPSNVNKIEGNNGPGDNQEYYRRHRHIRHHRDRHRHSHHNQTRHRSKCRHCESSHSVVDDTEVLEDSSSDEHQVGICGRTSANLTLTPAHLLSCQFWRWPDLTQSSELKKLPICHAAKDASFVCFNPYHWSRLCKPESPPPPYCLIPEEGNVPTKLGAENCTVEPNQTDSRRCENTTAPSRLPESLSNDGEGESERKEWCTLAYWELSNRIGRLYPVEQSTVSVFDSMHYGDGLCLASLTENHVSSSAVRRTRSQIGLGLMLSLEDDGIWAYNRSTNPIFVNSPTLDDPETRTLLVYRVPPGFCLNIYDLAKCPSVRVKYEENPPSGPIDMHSVRISFAKGWGPKYLRQDVTSCPCWLEILLAPCR